MSIKAEFLIRRLQRDMHTADDAERQELRQAIAAAHEVRVDCMKARYVAAQADLLQARQFAGDCIQQEQLEHLSNYAKRLLELVHAHSESIDAHTRGSKM